MLLSLYGPLAMAVLCLPRESIFSNFNSVSANSCDGVHDFQQWEHPGRENCTRMQSFLISSSSACRQHRQGASLWDTVSWVPLVKTEPFSQWCRKSWFQLSKRFRSEVWQGSHTVMHDVRLQEAPGKVVPVISSLAGSHFLGCGWVLHALDDLQLGAANPVTVFPIFKVKRHGLSQPLGSHPYPDTGVSA